MLGLVVKSLVLRRPRLRSVSLVGHRQFTFKAIYSSSFPATLLYYSPCGGSKLFDHKELDARPDGLWDEGVTVGNGSIVYPGLEYKDVSNGSVLFPNTFFMQELIRRYVDDAEEREEEGKKIEQSFIYTVPKGTPIPSNLILMNEYFARFSLQPSRGTPLRDVNLALAEFYDKYAQKVAAGEWLDGHPFESAVADDADPVWMAN